MNTHPPRRAAWLITALAAALGTACSSLPFGGAPAAAEPKATAGGPEAGEAVFATMKGGRTEQGGNLEGYAYAEKPGDAVFSRVQVVDGVASTSGVIWPQKGSTWGGVALNVTARPGKSVDVSAYKTVTLQLASSAPSLRIRLMGTDRATRDNGCYPVVVQPVTRELREYRIDLSRFASEDFCGSRAPGIPATTAALAAVEVADPSVSGGKRDVEFRVGRITFGR